jgi:hypothetical protein
MSKGGKILLGLGAANAVAVVLTYLSKLAVNAFSPVASSGNNSAGYEQYIQSAGVLIFSDFVIIPLLMGIIASAFWRNLEMRGVMYLVFSIPNTVIALIFSYFLFGEGYICILIVSPLLFSFVVAGAYLGKFMFRKKNRIVNSGVFASLLAILTFDFSAKHEYKNEVTDMIVINAPADKVWQYVAEYDYNREPDNYWLFKIGMPSPVQSTVSAKCAGADRKCIFSNGYTFDEKMTVYKPNEELTFEITKQPRDPEIMGHIDIVKGQFILKDNGNGTTTLVGTSWYKLYVFPSWYFNIWAESITRNVHLRVMEHIKNLSEKNV